MNRIAQQRSKRMRYIITDGNGRYLWRSWKNGWTWTHIKADARIYRNRGSAEERAKGFAGARVVALTN